MKYEIEHKFLVKDVSIIKQAIRHIDMVQGYFVTEKGISIRVRLQNLQAFLCIKGKVNADNNLVRSEFEYEIPLEDGEFMLQNFCKNRVIQKTRYYLANNQLTWEIDIFKGRHQGLALAEIELPNVDTPFDIPEWIGDDVSNDFKYTNLYLACN